MIVKCQFKKKGAEEFGGREYSYMTDIEDLTEGELVEIETPKGAQVLMVAKTHVPEEDAGWPADQLKKIARRYTPEEKGKENGN